MPDPTLAQLEIISDSPECTQALGAALGQALGAGDLICLCGELGAGKTVFSRGIGVGWGASSALTSPTYNLVHEHRRDDAGKLYHVDLYRIDGVDDATTLGLDDILEEAAATLIEWPERLGSLLPAEHLWIDFAVGEAHERQLTFYARGERHAQLLAAFSALITTESESQCPCCWR